MTQAIRYPTYDTFYAKRTRTSNNGVAVMPVADAYPTPCAVVSLHGGIEFDCIEYIAIRIGAPPEVPAPTTKNKNRIYLGGKQSAVFPIPNIGSVVCYGVTGEIQFAILTPEGLKSDFMIGNIPFAGIDNDERLPAQSIVYGLINDRVTSIADPTAEAEYYRDLPAELRRVLILNR